MKPTTQPTVDKYISEPFDTRTGPFAIWLEDESRTNSKALWGRGQLSDALRIARAMPNKNGDFCAESYGFTPKFVVLERDGEPVREWDFESGSLVLDKLPADPDVEVQRIFEACLPHVAAAQLVNLGGGPGWARMACAHAEELATEAVRFLAEGRKLHATEGNG